MNYIWIDLDLKVSTKRIFTSVKIAFYYIVLALVVGIYFDFQLLAIAALLVILGVTIYSYTRYYSKGRLKAALLRKYSKQYPNFRHYQTYGNYNRLMLLLMEWDLARQPYEPLVLIVNNHYHLYVDILPGQGDYLSKNRLMKAAQLVN